MALGDFHSPAVLGIHPGVTSPIHGPVVQRITGPGQQRLPHKSGLKVFTGEVPQCPLLSLLATGTEPLTGLSQEVPQPHVAGLVANRVGGDVHDSLLPLKATRRPGRVGVVPVLLVLVLHLGILGLVCIDRAVHGGSGLVLHIDVDGRVLRWGLLGGEMVCRGGELRVLG